MQKTSGLDLIARPSCAKQVIQDISNADAKAWFSTAALNLRQLDLNVSKCFRSSHIMSVQPEDGAALTRTCCSASAAAAAATPVSRNVSISGRAEFSPARHKHRGGKRKRRKELKKAREREKERRMQN